MRTQLLHVAIATVTLATLLSCRSGEISSSPSRAASLVAGPTFTTIDFPGSPASLAVDINDAGQIVGEYLYGNLQRRKGFLLSNGVYSSIVFPGATFTRAIGINLLGDIVGDYVISGTGSGNRHGYLLKGGVFTSIDFPNASGTLATGINASGDIAGWYIDKQGTHGFLLQSGAYTSIDFPGADNFTEAWRVNDGGEIFGRYEGTTDGKYHLFVLSNGQFTSVPDVPGSVQTAPGSFSEIGGLSGTGDIVSQYCSATSCALFNSVGDLHAFLLSGGVYTAIDFPGAPETLGFGVNSSDDVVGGYQDATGAIHGYLRTP
jgi:uncharacterized membrane protein